MARAQVGNCEQSVGEAILDAGNVRAKIHNNGALFWRGGAPVYEVPKGSGKNAIFLSNIWIGGMIENELRVLGSKYGVWDFWAGPLDEQGNPPDDCSLFDQIWEIRREDIFTYLTTGTVSSNLQSWPWQLGAPVIDGDGDPENYNLAGGDLPELLGDQRLWWIMNDRGGDFKYKKSAAIGLEVHGTAFSFAQTGPVGNTTFYSYRIINKNTSPLTDAYFSLFSEVDLGNYEDNFVGSDSLQHLGYVYNKDNFDEWYYEEAPPAIGFTFIESIVAKADGLDNDRDGETDEPGEMLGVSSVFHGTDDIVTKEHFYNSMRAMWCDDTHLMHGGHGHQDWNLQANLPMQPTKFSFSGDPVTRSFWSHNNIDGEGMEGYPFISQMATTTGSFEIVPGDTLDVKFAIVWSQGKNHLDSVTQLKRDAAGIRHIGQVMYAPTVVERPSVSSPNAVLGFEQNFPNPFSNTTTIRYSLPQTMQVKLSVYDILGREIDLLVDAQQTKGTYSIDFTAGNLNPGTYFARIELDHLRFTKRMVLAR